jgi:hypothetical protein
MTFVLASYSWLGDNQQITKQKKTKNRRAGAAAPALLFLAIQLS